MSHTAALAAVADRPLRYHNSNHAYFLGPDRCRSVTAIAKILTDDYTLNQWRERQVARGLTIKRSLCEDIAAAWNDTNKQDDIIKLSIEIAGAEDKARRGIQAHAATEFGDLDQPIITDQQARDLSVWRRTLDLHGFTVDPQWVERIVLYPQHLIAGRFDRVLWKQQRPVLADVKTGWNAVKYPQATSVQLALYLNAPLVARDATYDGTVEQVEAWEPMPADLDRDEAYVILLPTRDQGDDVGAVFAFDMHEGTVAARHAVYARHFQLNAGLCKAVDPQPTIGRDSTRLDALRRQVGLLSDDDKMALRARWDVATMGRLNEEMSRGQIDLAEALLAEIDPFRQVAEIPTTPSWIDKFRPAPPDEGEAVDADTYVEIAARYHRLAVEDKNWVGALEVDARAVGLNFFPSELSTRRRFNILLGLIDLCRHDLNDDDTARALAAAALDAAPADDVPTGAVIGALDVNRAVRFAELCTGLVEDRLFYDTATNRFITKPTEETHAHPSEPANGPQPETADHR